MKRVTSIGGIFFKCKNPAAINDWYRKHLGIETSPYGAKIPSTPANGADNDEGYTLWTPFADTTPYFQPSESSFMINYRVDNLEALIDALKQEGVALLNEMEVHEYGKFVHLLDPEGHKIELWEPPKA